MMVRKGPGHSQAVMARVLVVNETGALLVGALSTEQVGNCSLPTLQSVQETLHAREVVWKGNVIISQGVNPGKGEYRGSGDRL